jgi:hypothetical protein
MSVLHPYSCVYDARYFDEVWCVDTEFRGADGDRPDPQCLCALELKSGREIRMWADEFGSFPPYSVGRRSLFVAYNAAAEFGCHAVLGWPMPQRVLDLYVEFSLCINGDPPPTGKRKLISALARSMHEETTYIEC